MFAALRLGHLFNLLFTAVLLFWKFLVLISKNDRFTQIKVKFEVLFTQRSFTYKYNTVTYEYCVLSKVVNIISHKVGY